MTWPIAACSPRRSRTTHCGAPADSLLTSLRGKDVLLAFVESYGRSAVQGTSFSPGIDAVLQDGTQPPRRCRFSSRSAFLTSPTFGGASWLAHSTLQSGLRVDSQQRYNQLLTHERLTLTEAFSHAGWRTVFDVPANTIDWPEVSKFYGFDTLYDSGTWATADRSSATRRCPTSTCSPPSTGWNWPRPAAPGDGRDRPGVEPPSVDTAAAPGGLEPGRRRDDLQRHARAGRVIGGRFPRSREGARAVRSVHPVHAEHACSPFSRPIPTRTWS